ncbi:hypothetical protein BRC90_06815 [Halobacteriales archaeon QS_4_69_34]|nr:MAG: hypothetical protein BRC90_06815 [Halobacteriales archaeon QS_4_69_34]
MVHESEDDSGADAGAPTDYAAIAVPGDVPPEELTTEQRRADLLDRVLDAGSPSAVNQTRLAGRYGVDQSTVSRDMDALAAHVGDALGDRAALATRAAFDRAVSDLFDAGGEDGDWRATRAAWEVVREWAEWVDADGSADAYAAAGGDNTPPPDADAYQVVEPDGDAAAIPRTEDGEIDYEAAGFNVGPTTE